MRFLAAVGGHRQYFLPPSPTISSTSSLQTNNGHEMSQARTQGWPLFSASYPCRCIKAPSTRRGKCFYDPPTVRKRFEKGTKARLLCKCFFKRSLRAPLPIRCFCKPFLYPNSDAALPKACLISHRQLFLFLSAYSIHAGCCSWGVLCY